MKRRGFRIPITEEVCEAFKAYLEANPESWVKDANTKCWLWLGLCGITGHGVWWQPGKSRNRFAIHRVAYVAFIRPLPAGMQVNHVCAARNCFNPGHLYAGTQKQNMFDMTIAGRSPIGERNGHAKFTNAQVFAMREFAADHPDFEVNEVASKYGVSSAQMSLLLRGLIYATAGGRLTHKRRDGFFVRGEDHGSTDFTDKQIIAMRELMAERRSADPTYTIRAFIDELNIGREKPYDRTTIEKILSGVHFGHLPGPRTKGKAAKYTPDEEAALITGLKAGWTLREAKEKLGVSSHTFYKHKRLLGLVRTRGATKSV